jgi:Family of unknown function (DUF6069)
MTATTTFTAPATRPSAVTTAKSHIARTGLVAGAGAAVATIGFAGLVRAADVPLTVSGSPIPPVGFGPVTFVAALVGTLIAVVLSRRASRPQHTFLVTTLAMTLASFIPDLTADAHTATKVALMLSHVLAAAIVIPALASRLSD